MVHPEPVFPCVGLIISGGHTSLYSCACPTDMTLVGSTTDDAAGEAFDKVASILGLGYPGGPAIERAAKAGDARAYDFPRSLIDEDNLDFSFSGLKTAVLYTVWGQNAKDRGRVLSEREVADVAASFQEAVIDVLVEKARRAVRQMGVGTLCVGGGVAAHRRLRSRLVAMADEERVRLVIAPVEYCTDNAAMAAVAVEKWKRGEFSPLDLDAGGGLERRT
jgi:N6-L-threonylcarbamoyladenine synthase